MKKIVLLMSSMIFAWGVDITYSDLAGKSISDAECTMNIYSNHTFDEDCTGEPLPGYGIWSIENGSAIFYFAWANEFGSDVDSTTLYFPTVPAVGSVIEYHDSIDEDGDGNAEEGQFTLTEVTDVATDKLVPYPFTFDGTVDTNVTIDVGGSTTVTITYYADMTFKETWNPEDTEYTTLGTWSMENGVILRKSNFTNTGTGDISTQLSILSMDNSTGTPHAVLEQDYNDDQILETNSFPIITSTNSPHGTPAYVATTEDIRGKRFITKIDFSDYTCVSSFYTTLIGKQVCTTDSTGYERFSGYFSWSIENGYVVANINPTEGYGSFFSASFAVDVSPAVGETMTAKLTADRDNNREFDITVERILKIEDIPQKSKISPAIIMYLLN